MSKEVLTDTLRLFYPSWRQNLDEEDETTEAKPYSKQSLINIHSSLNRYLQMPPDNKTLDLMHDPEFIPANKVFSGTFHCIKFN